MFFVYVLWNAEVERPYIGSCEDLNRRLDEHRRTKPGYDLVYQEERVSKLDALKREMYLKSGNGRRALKNLLADKSL